jgi:hypothetical protein
LSPVNPPEKCIEIFNATHTELADVGGKWVDVDEPYDPRHYKSPANVASHISSVGQTESRITGLHIVLILEQDIN